MGKSQYTILGLLAIMLLSCKREKTANFYVGEPQVIHIIPQPRGIPNPKLAFSFNSIELYQEIGSVNLNRFKPFGSFYTEDFMIYQINDLDLLEDNMYISEIYLYFVYDKLHKIQAFTTKNMADFFLSKYGGAKLVLKDRFNKELAKKEGAVSSHAGGIILNKNLSNYKLKWQAADRLISYQVDESDQKNFEALEELVDIENQQKIKVQPKYVFTIQSNEYQKLLQQVKQDEMIAAIK